VSEQQTVDGGNGAFVYDATKESLWSDAYRRLKRDKLAMLCFWVIVGYVVVAAMAFAGSVVNDLHHEDVVGDGVKSFADSYLFADYAESDRELGAAAPGPGGWMGTNIQGQSIASRLANGARIALGLGFFVGLIAIVIGAVLGSIAGWFGGWVDEVVVWLYSTVSSIPAIMLILALSYVLGGGFFSVFLAMGLTYWVGVCRVVRGEFLKLKDRDYVLAAKAQGFSNMRIMLGHVLPNTAHLLIISFTLLFVWAIKAEVVISFLGVGIQDQPSWGLMIQDAESELTKGRLWQMGFTSAALFGIVLAFQVFGDSLRDALDPRLRR
jgi:peptide/nickel transport system permease protein